MGRQRRASVIVSLAMAAPLFAEEAKLVSLQKIWDHGSHNAFTDLILFQGQWFCSFREGEKHVGDLGKIRVLTSRDGEVWRSAALLEERGVDLRDPKLSVTPSDRLMLLAGGTLLDESGKIVNRRPRVAFSSDGSTWNQWQPILSDRHWLWRVTWNDGYAWGVSYLGGGGLPDDRQGFLFRSKDGIRYEQVADLHLPGASETTVRFTPQGDMVTLVRFEYGNKNARIAVTRPPHADWNWHELDERVGGPNFIILPDGRMIAGGRHYGEKPSTVIARLTPTSYTPLLTLPSGGDTSYPGLVWHDGLLWVSYYSSHEGKSNIYLAKVRLAD